jgi:hypothetical protein
MEDLTTQIKLKLNDLFPGYPAGAIAVAYIEMVIHLCNQKNGNKAFRESVLEMFEDAIRIIKETL